MYSYLRQSLGAKAGAKAFTEFKEQNDPGAPTTVVDKKFPYETVKHPNPKLTAIPDDPRAPLTGGPTGTDAELRPDAPEPNGARPTSRRLGRCPST